MFAWPWVKEVLLKPLVDRLGSVAASALVGFGMTQPDATKVAIGVIAFAMWACDIAILTVEKKRKGKI